MRVHSVLWRSLQTLGRNPVCVLFGAIPLTPVLAAIVVWPQTRGGGFEVLLIAAALLAVLLPGAVTPTLMRSLDKEAGTPTPGRSGAALMSCGPLVLGTLLAEQLRRTPRVGV